MRVGGYALTEVYGPGLTFEDLDVEQREALRMCESILHRDLDEYHNQHTFSHPSMYGQGLQHMGPNPW